MAWRATLHPELVTWSRGRRRKEEIEKIVMRCNAGKLYSVCMHCIITVQLEEVCSMSHIVDGGDDRGQHSVENLQCLGSNTRGILLGGWGDARTGGVRYIYLETFSTQQRPLEITISY